MIINCIAVDDEPLALGLICDYINNTPFFNLVGRYPNAIEALKTIHEQQVDLVFLDIKMPNLNGIELGKILNTNPHIVKIIFTTAFDQYALDGFKVDALDYLLKPFNYIDFSKAANKAFTYFQMKNQILQEKEKDAIKAEEYLYVKVEYQLVKIALNDILYIESLKDYVKIFLVNEEKPILSLITMKSLDEKLTKKGFMRLHRSFIVSLSKVQSVTKNSVQINQVIINTSEQYHDVFSSFYYSWFKQTS